MTRRILCVCHGNTCRSPMARAVLAALARGAGCALEVDSAGIAPRNPGAGADPRAVAAASARGHDISAHRVRAVAAADLARFDLVLAMDRAVLGTLEAQRPEGARAPLRLFDPQGRDIPDPYHGGPDDYAHALGMIEAAARALMAQLAQA